MANPKLRIIGWREWISLPELALHGLKVKVDSGAHTSALHATQIKYLIQPNGETWVSFIVMAGRVKARLVEKRKVKSSLGHATLRPVISTRIQIGDESWPIEITLVNRDPMGHRMLLGRSALKDRFLVHPSRSFIQSGKSKKQKAQA